MDYGLKTLQYRELPYGIKKMYDSYIILKIEHFVDLKD